MLITLVNEIENIKEEIERLETKRFYLDMKDSFTSDDFKYYDILTKEINELRIKLETLV